MNNGRNTLWYREPAHTWNEALPLGNGRLGAMAFGGVCEERIGLNEDSLWTGYPAFCDQPGAYDAMQRARKLVMEDKLEKAQRLLEDEFTGDWSQAYLPLGDLKLHMLHGETAENYRRELDLSTGVHVVEYTCGGAAYRRELFVSHPDQAMVLRLSADKPFSFDVKLTTQLQAEYQADGNTLCFFGNAPLEVWPNGASYHNPSMKYGETDAEKGMGFYTEARIITDGEVLAKDGALHVKCETAVILLNARTSFNGWNRHPVLEGREYVNRCKQELDEAQKHLADLLERHIADHSALYDRVDFWLDGGEEALLPTDERLCRHEDGEADVNLYALLFHYGRYLTIAGSREGTHAMNLQGIWNEHLSPPWNCNYTININTEMNYWPTLMVDLPECAEPLHRLIAELAESGKRAAQVYYHAPGFVAHHNTDLWRVSTPMGVHLRGCAGYALWQMGGAWLCRHLWEQYEYMRDENWLRAVAWPILKEGAAFCLSQLTQDADGRLILPATTSPENWYDYNGQHLALAREAAMTQAIVEDLFDIVLKTAKVLDEEDEWTAQIASALEQLGRPGIASNGTLLEWAEEYEEAEVHHRHISHLYGLHPGRSITVDDQPELAQACKKSLERRGDESTGWAMGWRICQWARLRDGDHALQLIQNQLRNAEGRNSKDDNRRYTLRTGGTYPNLLDAHPPFQIDGNFGACAGIGEMLLQMNEKGELLILPALPKTWTKGGMRGMRTRRGTHVDIAWDGERVEWKEY